MKPCNSNLSAIVNGHDLRIGDGFEAMHFSEDMFHGWMDPVVMLDHFRMTSPTFSPHPHAGISAVTYVFEDSIGPHVNYDSLGNHGPIQPGDLHWFVAGGGAIHTEQPERGPVHALQIFVNLPARLKRCKPYAVHLNAADVPTYRATGIRVRVVAGDWRGLSSPVSLPTPFILLDGFLDAYAGLDHDVPVGWHTTILVVSGVLNVGNLQDVCKVEAGQAVCVTGPGSVELSAANERTHFVILSGIALKEPIAKRGPFVMNTEDELSERIRAYENGELGHLDAAALGAG